MRARVKITACLLLLLALCGCRYESRVAGTWQGDGEGAGVERWVFDGTDTAVATVDGRDIALHYYASDDTLTLNDGGEVSWGVGYERKGDDLYIAGAKFTKAE